MQLRPSGEVSEFALPVAVCQIDHHTNCQPDYKPPPCQPRQSEHEVDAGSDAEYRYERNQRSPEGSRTIRVTIPEDDDPDTDEDEGEQRSDISQLNDFVDVGDAGDSCDDDSCPYGCYVRRSVLRVYACEVFRQQPVARH